MPYNALKYVIFMIYHDSTNISTSPFIELNNFFNWIFFNFFNWIIFWIEFLWNNIELNIKLNNLLAKFKYWIESIWVSFTPNKNTPSWFPFFCKLKGLKLKEDIHLLMLFSKMLGVTRSSTICIAIIVSLVSISPYHITTRGHACLIIVYSRAFLESMQNSGLFF